MIPISSKLLLLCSSIFYRLSSVVFPLSTDRYLPAFETLTACTEMLRFAQNDDVRRTADSGQRLAEQSSILYRLSSIFCLLSSAF